MGVKAQNQVTILDITDAYSVILSNENQTFRETSYNSGTTAQTTSTTIYSYRGSTNVYGFIPSSALGPSHANTDGVYITIDSSNVNPAQDLTVTIHIPAGLTQSGIFTIPVELYETTTTTGDPLATFNQDFSYSVARYGHTGQSGEPATIYELSYTGTLFNFDNETGQYTAPATIAVTATSQTGDSAATPYTSGTITVTPYTATGAAGTPSTSSTSVTITPVVENNAPKYLYYIATLTVNNQIVDRQTIGTTRQGANGEDAYAIDITSSNGFVFKNTSIGTTLTAHVYSGGTEITRLDDLHSLGLTINWYEGSGSTPVTSDSLTKTYTSYNVTDLLHVTVKLEDYSAS